MISNATIIDPPLTFSWLDYAVFGVMLSVSGIIGIFFGCFGTKQNSTDEYLLGGRKLHILPVSMSIIASNISGLAVLGVSADIYRYGAAHVWALIPIAICPLACIYVYMPVFLKLKLITTYQYLQIRFDNTIKMLASFIYIFHLIIYNPVVIFLPCLAFNQGTFLSLVKFEGTYCNCSDWLQRQCTCTGHNHILRILHCHWWSEDGGVDGYPTNHFNTAGIICCTWHGFVPRW
uniref:Sodium-dependent multivitamin transporter n=1 Tax=Photinus pyralis TaxID=7054 RepID=A0A1Y1MY70_PHOPY